MSQNKPIEEPKPRERTPLRTAVLVALLQREEGYGYDITGRLSPVVLTGCNSSMKERI